MCRHAQPCLGDTLRSFYVRGCSLQLLPVLLAVATLRTRDVYSRVLKHSGDKIHPRIHPAFTEPLADASVSNLSSPEAVELVFGTREGGDGGEVSPSSGGLDWLHPSGTSDHAKGVSVVAAVDPMSRKGLETLEQVGFWQKELRRLSARIAPPRCAWGSAPSPKNTS